MPRAIVITLQEELPDRTWQDVRDAIQRVLPINLDLPITEWSGDVDTFARGFRVYVQMVETEVRE